MYFTPPVIHGNASYHSGLPVPCLKSYRLTYTNLSFLPVAFFGCKIRTLSLREEYRLRVFENRVLIIFGPKWEEVAGGWRSPY
jgi:hypothetical protein